VLVFFLHRIYYSLPAVALVNLLERGIQRSVSSGRPAHTWCKTEMVHDVNFFLSIGINATEQQEVKLTILRVFNIDRFEL
jgi:hypothetical protein